MWSADGPQEGRQEETGEAQQWLAGRQEGTLAAAAVAAGRGADQAAQHQGLPAGEALAARW